VHCDCGPSQLDSGAPESLPNARDAMPDGGVLTIEAKNTVLDAGMPIRIPALRQASSCGYVSDSGSGISTENLARSSSHSSPPREPESTGLGLSMCTVLPIIAGPCKDLFGARPCTDGPALPAKISAAHETTGASQPRRASCRIGLILW